MYLRKLFFYAYYSFFRLIEYFFLDLKKFEKTHTIEKSELFDKNLKKNNANPIINANLFRSEEEIDNGFDILV